MLRTWRLPIAISVTRFCQNLMISCSSLLRIVPYSLYYGTLHLIAFVAISLAVVILLAVTAAATARLKLAQTARWFWLWGFGVSLSALVLALVGIQGVL